MSAFVLDGRLWETERQVPSLNARLKVYIMQEDDFPPTQRQLEILESLDRLPKGFQHDIATHAWNYYRQIDADVDFAQEGRAIEHESITSHYTIKSILIPEIRNCEANYLFISANCDWEEEHGMQLLVRDGQVISCGDHSTLPFSSQWKNVISASDRESQGELLRRYLA